MELNELEKTFLKQLITKQLEDVHKTQESLWSTLPHALKAEHEYEDFLRNLVKKFE